MGLLSDMLEGVGSVVMLGHLRPDGDCVGSSLGLYNYLLDQYPKLEVTLFLEPPSEKFNYLKNFDCIRSCADQSGSWDLCITVDSSDTERLGTFVRYFQQAKKTWCIDHHITNRGFADVNTVAAGCSSSSEVVYGLLEDEHIDRSIAECLYTGIIHDTGVFKYSSTTERTMQVAGRLLAKGVDSATIIDNSFYRKNYVQNQVLGRALLESILILDGRCVFSAISRGEMEFYGVDSKDLDGIIDQLRITEGVECAIFLYEVNPHEYKVSLRANGDLDVSRIAGYFGGGGHVKAAGCTMNGTVNDVINNLALHIEKQLRELGCQTE